MYYKKRAVLSLRPLAVGYCLLFPKRMQKRTATLCQRLKPFLLSKRKGFAKRKFVQAERRGQACLDYAKAQPNFT